MMDVYQDCKARGLPQHLPPPPPPPPAPTVGIPESALCRDWLDQDTGRVQPPPGKVLRYQQCPYKYNRPLAAMDGTGVKPEPQQSSSSTYTKFGKTSNISIPSRHYPQNFLVHNGMNAGPTVYDYPTSRGATEDSDVMDTGDVIPPRGPKPSSATSRTPGKPTVYNDRHSAGDRREAVSKCLERQTSWGSAIGWEDPQDLEHLHDSLTLPRIEAVLRSEGIEQDSILQQISKIKERCRRVDGRKPPHLRHKSQPIPRLKLPSHPKNSSTTKTDGAPSREKKEGVPTAKDLLAASKPSPSCSPREEAIETARSKANEHINAYLSDIEDTRWLSHQQMERSIMGKDLPPRLVIVTSNVARSEELLKTVRTSRSVLLICYDFEKSTYDSLLDEIRHKLNSYKKGCKMRSMLLYCQGGPGYIYMFKRKVVTAQKMQKKENQDLICFWKNLGDLFSKLQEKECYLHIMGCDVLAKKQGDQLLQEVSSLFKPNKVQLEAPAEDTEDGRAMLDMYFDCDRYYRWKTNDTYSSRSSSASSRHTYSIRDLQS